MKMTKALPDNRGLDTAEHQEYLGKGGAPYQQVTCPPELYPAIL